MDANLREEHSYQISPRSDLKESRGLGFFDEVALTRMKKKKMMMSSDMRSVPDLKTRCT